MKLEGKVAVVTGGSLGIGRCTSELFAREGARVVIASRGAQAAEEVVRAIRAAGGEACFVPTDVRERSQVEALMARVREEYGRLDVLVNNAGINPPHTRVPITDLEDEDWDLLISVNLTGVYYACKYAVRLMRENGGGTIVNTSSILGLKASRNRAGYMASKGGVTQLTKALALDHAADGIRVNEVNPAFIHTPLNDDIVQAARRDPERWRQLTGGLHALGRLGGPEEVARAILFLASDDSSFVTGHSLLVDGGARIKWGLD